MHKYNFFNAQTEQMDNYDKRESFYLFFYIFGGCATVRTRV